MDSLTQATLGAAVGIAVMGRTRPVWQSALLGALVGTLPDLDVFIDKGGEVRNMVLHRAETHALFYQALATPLIAWLLAIVSGSRELYRRWCLMVLLGLFTHSLLDAMTIYGTRIWLPFTDHPVGQGSLFIIDPLYTLPLLVGLVSALALRSPRRYRWNAGGLILSTIYAAWSLAAQAYVTGRVETTSEARSLPQQQVLVTPTPFNTLLWRIVLIDDDSYAEGFYSLLDPLTDPPARIAFERFPRGGHLEGKTADFEQANMIRTFSKGFYALSDDGHHVRITDLRMGQHPYFAFSFAFAEHRSEPLKAIEPVRTTGRIPVQEGLRWLWRRMLAPGMTRPRLPGDHGPMRPGALDRNRGLSPGPTP